MTHAHEATHPLRTARQQQKLSLREVAARAGIAHATLWKIEQGHAQPSVPVLYRLAGVLGLERLTAALHPFVAGPYAERAGTAPASATRRRHRPTHVRRRGRTRQ